MNKIFLTGYAKLPSGITASENSKTLVLGLIINKKTGEILDVDCSLITRTAKDFVLDYLLGKDINKVSEISEAFDSVYYGSAKRAIVSALKIIYEKYKIIDE